MFWQDVLAITYQRSVRYLYQLVKVYWGISRPLPLFGADYQVLINNSLVNLLQTHTCVVQNIIFKRLSGNNPMVSLLESKRRAAI